MHEGDELEAHGRPATPAGPGVVANRSVFISYASQDAAMAQVACSALEGAGFACWIAPRDVLAGTIYADSIVRAIDECKLFVLILTAGAVASVHVGKELERASSHGHPILALRVDAAPLPPAFEYFLNESQWIEVAGGIDASVDRLVDAVRRHLSPTPIKGSSKPAESTVGTPRTPTLSRKSWIKIAVAVVVAVAFMAAARPWVHLRDLPARHAASPMVAAGDKSIAVLPFADMSEKRDQEYFADGMAEEILDLLVRIPGLKVIGRTSSFQFKGKSADLRNIGSALGATYVVEGSVRKAGDRIRVTAQLIDTRSGTHSWSSAYDREFGDVLALQHDIALGIARALQVTVGTDDSRSQGKLRNAEAYTLYLRGRYAMDRGDLGAYQEAQTDFEQALALDPSFVRAAENLANAYAGPTANELIPSEVGWRKSRQAADLALSLDPNSASAHTVLGIRLALYEFDLPAADAQLAIALKADPRNAVVLSGAGRLALIRGRFDEALRLMSTALTLDPLDPATLQNIGYIQYFAGHLPAAEAALRNSIEISPTFSASHYVLGQVLLAQGEAQAALQEFEKVTPDDGKDAGLAIAYFALGRRAESDRSLDQLTERLAADWPYGIAQVHAYRMDRDSAILWLDKAYAQRDPDLQLVKVDPLLRNLRDDPRYESFLRKMKRLE